VSDARFLTARREGPVLIVTIGRPEVLNALHTPAHEELAATFDAFATDDRLRAAILTGAGQRAFCAGNDLKHQATHGFGGLPPSGFAGLTSRFDLTKPLIAAVNGLAMGGGFEAALACDIVVAGEHARFALPEPRVGMAALAGGLLRLPRIIGLKRAMPLILTGRAVTAAEGDRLGFVSEVTAPGQELDRALAIAEEIAACGPAAVRAAKQVATLGLDLPLPEAMKAQWDWPAVQAMRASPDYGEGARAFAEKRPPRWA
jgi:crotonobetainyl-CoA hydratase